ncbi:hypothetical protein GCM10009548_02080 [Streptomyces malaysiensis subsp. malaysiensis]|uniref:Uncharacterized protein n=1 Tax=Streptomyces malaysiensis TaxID=92644 RepID=A0ABX6W4A7_STRMQ|nr:MULTISPECIES: hypothetical protein [Streptomyces]QPI56328.1 hypothetical protein I1A49_16510 [Streptomyces solisilvae]UHH17814.1 hypothetical protein LUV23_16625 [Streptomyces sp. HNM0561]
MALYLVSRTDHHDYDEYDAIVVRAGDEATALKIATNGEEETYGDDVYWDADFQGFERDGSNLIAERIDVRGPSELVLASFNAG